MLPLHGKLTCLDRVRFTSMFMLRVPANGVEVDTRKMSGIWLGEHKSEEFLVERTYTKVWK